MRISSLNADLCQYTTYTKTVWHAAVSDNPTSKCVCRLSSVGWRGKHNFTLPPCSIRYVYNLHASVCSSRYIRNNVASNVAVSFDRGTNLYADHRYITFKTRKILTNKFMLYENEERVTTECSAKYGNVNRHFDFNFISCVNFDLL